MEWDYDRMPKEDQVAMNKSLMSFSRAFADDGEPFGIDEMDAAYQAGWIEVYGRLKNVPWITEAIKAGTNDALDYYKVTRRLNDLPHS